MAGHSPETRRAFLLRLAATAAFVPPAMMTVDVRPLLAQGQGGGGGGGKGSSTSSTSSSTVGSLSPTAQVITKPVFSEDVVTPSTSTAPWDAAGPAQIPPWARQPPGSSGH